MITDKNYIEALKMQKIEALEFIADKYSNLIFRAAYKVLNDKELSKECVNDVLVKIWTHGVKFNKQEEQFKNWVFTIAKYTAIDRLRKENKHNSNLEIDHNVISEEKNIESQYEKKEKLQLLKNEIDLMDSLDKEIFIRRFYYEDKIKVIANELGLSENAVNLRILRGRKRLNEKINGGNK